MAGEASMSTEDQYGVVIRSLTEQETFWRQEAMRLATVAAQNAALADRAIKTSNALVGVSVFTIVMLVAWIVSR